MCIAGYFPHVSFNVESTIYEDEEPSLHGMCYKLLVVRVQVVGRDCRTGVNNRNGREEGDVVVWCFPERKTTHY